MRKWIAFVLLLAMVCPVYAAEIPDDASLTWIDASVDEPENYDCITGFTITYKITEKGYMGSQEDPFLVNGIMVAKGKQNIDGFTWDGQASVPKFLGPAEDIVSHVTGDGSFVATMFFKNGIDGGAAAVGESITFTYEGTEALFAPGDPYITIHSLFNTGVEIENITWIMGQIKESGPKLEWESVEKVEYLDVPTCDAPSEFNYVNITVPAGGGPYPVVLWIHGGGWTQLDRYSCFISDTMDYLLSRGFAVVSAEYTKSVIDGDNIISGYPQMIYDLKLAVRFLRANGQHYNLDTSFIAAMGESAGAHLSMLMGTTNGDEDYEDLSMGHSDYSSDVQAMISYFGPADCVKDTMMAYAILGVDYTMQQAMAVSPYYQIDRDSPPLYLTHGRNDNTVSVDHSIKMQERAESVLGEENVVAKYYDNAPHANIAVFDSDEAIRSVAEFLTDRLEKHRLSNPPVQETEPSEPIPTEPAPTEPAPTPQPSEKVDYVLPAVILGIGLLAAVLLILQKKRR